MVSFLELFEDVPSYVFGVYGYEGNENKASHEILIYFTFSDYVHNFLTRVITISIYMRAIFINSKNKSHRHMMTKLKLFPRKSIMTLN